MPKQNIEDDRNIFFNNNVRNCFFDFSCDFRIRLHEEEKEDGKKNFGV